MISAIFLNTLVKMKTYDLDELSVYPFKKIAFVKWEEMESFHLELPGVFDLVVPHDIENDGSFCFEQVVKTINALINGNYISNDIKIICLSEDNLLLAGKIRDEFRLTGFGYTQTIYFRNKSIMKKRLQKAGIRTPKHNLFDVSCARSNVKRTYEKYLTEFGCPFILKPISALGSLGVSKIYSEDEYADILNGIPLEMDYEIEEYIDGTLFHHDSMSVNGKILFSEVCEYSYPNMEIKDGKPILSIPLEEGSQTRIEIENFGIKALAALGITDGPAHMEIFKSKNGEAIFLEVGARTPGGNITQMYKQSSGASLPNWDFCNHLGIQYTPKEKSKLYYFCGFYPSKSGVVSNLLFPEIQSEYSINHCVKKGDSLINSDTVRDISALIIVKNRSYESLKHDFHFMKLFEPIEYRR